jgi:hypothetical protein
VLREQAADERSDRQRHGGDAGPDPDRHPALTRREGGGDDREGGRVHERSAGALYDSCADQKLTAPGQTADERGEREDREACDEDQPAAEEVGELSTGEHQRGERERISGHDPLELGESDVEVGGDRRQRHVDHRVVEHDHEEPERDRRQGPPLACVF